MLMCQNRNDKTMKRCTKCGEECENIEFHKKNECTQDFFSVYNYAKLKGIDLDEKKSDLNRGDTVKLIDACEMLFSSCGDGEKYKEAHEMGIKGKIVDLEIVKTHYQWGEYASVEWENGWNLNSIHSGWLAKLQENA